MNRLLRESEWENKGQNSDWSLNVFAAQTETQTAEIFWGTFSPDKLYTSINGKVKYVCDWFPALEEAVLHFKKSQWVILPA